MKDAQEFDCSFMAARTRALFEAVEQVATAGANDAVNYAALSPTAKMLWPAATLQRMDMLEEALLKLRARRAEIVELLEEQTAEA